MHTTTMSEIRELETILSAKKDRISAIENIIADIRRRYHSMTNAQLTEAIRDVRGMEKELENERAWCKKTEARIKAFYAPATMVA